MCVHWDIYVCWGVCSCMCWGVFTCMCVCVPVCVCVLECVSKGLYTCVCTWAWVYHGGTLRCVVCACMRWAVSPLCCLLGHGCLQAAQSQGAVGCLCGEQREGPDREANRVWGTGALFFQGVTRTIVLIVCEVRQRQMPFRGEMLFLLPSSVCDI